MFVRSLQNRLRIVLRTPAHFKTSTDTHTNDGVNVGPATLPAKFEDREWETANLEGNQPCSMVTAQLWDEMDGDLKKLRQSIETVRCVTCGLIKNKHSFVSVAKRTIAVYSVSVSTGSITKQTTRLRCSDNYLRCRSTYLTEANNTVPHSVSHSATDGFQPWNMKVFVKLNMEYMTKPSLAASVSVAAMLVTAYAMTR